MEDAFGAAIDGLIYKLHNQKCPLCGKIIKDMSWLCYEFSYKAHFQIDCPCGNTGNFAFKSSGTSFRVELTWMDVPE